MNETAQFNSEPPSETRLKLLSKEVEEAAERFLASVEELEELLVLIEE
jgi:hypothetical protein